MNDEATLPPSFSFAARSHVGARSNNEDRVFVDDALGLYLVADGVGGHLAGEVASRISCEIVAQEVRDGQSLEASIRRADRAVHNAVISGEGRKGMASTLVAALLRPDALEVAWVGDSRAYLWDGEALILVTQDHSLVAAMVANGEITSGEALTHPQRNVILQALGQSAEDALTVGKRHLTAIPKGATMLLCSDGLSDVITAPELAGLLQENLVHGLGDTADALIEAALAAEGRDNISVLLFAPENHRMQAAALPEQDYVWVYDPARDQYSYGAVDAFVTPTGAVPGGEPGCGQAAAKAGRGNAKGVFLGLGVVLALAAAWSLGGRF